MIDISAIIKDIFKIKKNKGDTRLDTGVLNLDIKRSIWVDEAEQGKERTIRYNGYNITFEVPAKIDGKITLRFKGQGKTNNDKSGDLLLDVLLNKGIDFSKDLWISEAIAKNGGTKKFSCNSKVIDVTIPMGCSNGSILRLKGQGEQPGYMSNGPLPNLKRGDLFLKLRVFPDRIRPSYGSIRSLNTDEMGTEGQIYVTIDELKRKGIPPSNVKPIPVERITDLYNENGWESIYWALVSHIGLDNARITVEIADGIPQAGTCEMTGYSGDSILYTVKINTAYLDDPFCVAAILSHELCHVLYWEKIGRHGNNSASSSGKMSAEDERTIDLLAFAYRLGEFQLRVARDRHMTFGYFNQINFERMYVILSRKYS